MKNEIYQKIKELDEAAVYQEIKNRLEHGDSAAQLLEECRAAMELAIQSYEKRDTYLDALLDAARMVNKASELCLDKLPADGVAYCGKVLTCTVENDVHQNGRLMAVSVLRARGFDVTDLGGEVPPEVIIDAVANSREAILALSGLVSTCVESMKRTIDALHAADLYPVTIVAGGIAGEHLRKYAGADYFAKDIPATVRICQKYFGEAC